jgi:hypothetical protein
MSLSERDAERVCTCEPSGNADLGAIAGAGSWRWATSRAQRASTALTQSTPTRAAGQWHSARRLRPAQWPPTLQTHAQTSPETNVSAPRSLSVPPGRAPAPLAPPRPRGGSASLHTRSRIARARARSPRCVPRPLRSPPATRAAAPARPGAMQNGGSPGGRPRVLVIGAGFAGVALAVALQARGVADVTLVDRCAAPAALPGAGAGGRRRAEAPHAARLHPNPTPCPPPPPHPAARRTSRSSSPTRARWCSPPSPTPRSSRSRCRGRGGVAGGGPRAGPAHACPTWPLPPSPPDPPRAPPPDPSAAPNRT